MKNHTKVYFEYFNYDISDFVPCEVCQQRSVDIHHIIFQSKFGKKRKDEQDKIENLIALCRIDHDKAHANILTKEFLTEMHLKFMNSAKPTNY